MNKSIFAILAAFSLCGCSGSSSQSSNEDDSEVVGMSIEDYQTNKTFFMIRDDKLPKKVNLKQSIEGLSYQNLRLLRSYVYAVHGHWFMEGDLNSFFTNHTDWYEDACLKAWFKDYGSKQDWWDSTTELQKKYMEMYDKDYKKTYGLIKLSKEEQDFVDAIDKRMDDLRKQGKAKSPDGVEILNSNLAINMYQVNDPSKRMLNMLAQYNAAIEPSNYEQLFNVYENNDYLSMPNFVTTDVMLQLYHMYFSYILKTLEGDEMNKCLYSAVEELMVESAKATGEGNELAVAQASWNTTFFSVAMNLLGHNPSEVAGKHNISLHSAMGEYQKAFDEECENVRAEKDAESSLFDLDGKAFMYSLFKPRGHYTRKESTRQYFRTMMWLQKGCLMREESLQLRQAISMAQLLNRCPKARKNLDRINSAITFLMGEPDNVSIIELADFIASKGYNGTISDNEYRSINSWLKDKFKTRNRIKPKQQIGAQDQLNLMPQRYMFDSEILGTMYDSKPNADRAYPSGLDVMDILGVQTATNVLDEFYNKNCPWADYKKERTKIKTALNGKIDWDKTIYNKWMKTLVELQKKDKNQPGFMKTEMWGIKNLNTALASWALLKHDAILYGEQPLGAECGGGGEFPDPYRYGYVEPNIKFWEEMLKCIDLTESMLKKTGFADEKLSDKAYQLRSMTEFLLEFSKDELAGKPIDQGRHATVIYIGGTIENITLGLVDPDITFDTWDQVKGADRSVAQVADVFTRNILGCEKQGILHEATGNANIIYVIVNIGGEYRLTRGATYSYYEFVRPMDERLNDEEWQKMILDNKAPNVPEWFAPWLLGGKKVDCDQRFVYGSGC